MLRDERRRKRFTFRIDTVCDHTDRFHGGCSLALELEEQGVLPISEVLFDFLDRVHDSVDANESHDVSGNTTWKGNDEILGPLFQRGTPRQECEFLFLGIAG